MLTVMEENVTEVFSDRGSTPLWSIQRYVFGGFHFMKRLGIVLLISLILVCAAGCGKKDAKKEDPLQEDLVSYINQVQAIKPLEESAASQYNQLVSNIDINDRTSLVNAFDQGIIPTYSDFLNKLSAISPATEQVKKLKDSYVAASNQILSGFQTFEQAFKESNTDMLDQADASVKSGIDAVNACRAELEKTAASCNVTIVSSDAVSSDGTMATGNAVSQ